jgi:hypothetical protein
MSADFFEAMYARAEGDDAGVPWQQAISRRLIGDWFQAFEPAGHEHAMVVAAGLGDDAARLAGLGLNVVAFDHSPTAVGWAESRHPDAGVDWHVADLFAPPAHWVESFDLVVEVFTIQSIDPADQSNAASIVGSFVAPGGTLVAVSLVHDGGSHSQGPPWPLHPSTFGFLTDGFTERYRQTERLDAELSCILVELRRAHS